MKIIQLILWWVVVNILLPTLFCLATKFILVYAGVPSITVSWAFDTIFFMFFAIAWRIPRLWIRWHKPYTTRAMDLEDIIENKMDYYNPLIYNTPFKLHCERLFGNH